MEADYIIEEEDFWKCRKHPSHPRSGVCPFCLRDRLLLLCPACASVRPCSCLPSSSSSSSSFSSYSSFDPPRSSVSGAIGAVGRVSSLIESEPAFRRSRSAAFAVLRPRSEPEAEKRRRWEGFWGFLKAKAEKKEDLEGERFSRSRSRSVGVEISDPSSREQRLNKGRKWHFPSPMRAFRQKKSTEKVVLDRSPLCRG